MRRACVPSGIRLTLLFALLGVLTLRVEPRQPQPEVRLDQLQPGTKLTEDRVSAFRDKAFRDGAQVSRQVFFQGYLEQWVFTQPDYYRIEVEFRLDDEPTVKTVQRNPPQRP